MRVDAKKLKNRLTLEDYKTIMKALDIPQFGTNNGVVIYWSGEKNKNALDGSPKLYFYTDSRIFIGYTSSASYDIFSLVQKRLGLLNKPASFIDAINFILSATGINGETCQRITTKHQYNWENELGKYIRFRKTGSMLPVYDAQILNELSIVYPQQWIDEGISIESMEKYQIRYYDRCNQTIIPCFNKMGELIGIRVRNWETEKLSQAKYIPLTLLNGFTYKFPTNQTLYGLNYNWAEIERSQSVTIVESEKAVLKYDTFYGATSNCVAMYGSNLGTYRRNELLKLGVKEVFFVVDNDWIDQDQQFYNQWQKKIQAQANLWKGYATVWLVWDNQDLLSSKDNALDRDKDTYERLLETKERIV